MMTMMTILTMTSTVTECWAKVGRLERFKSMERQQIIYYIVEEMLRMDLRGAEAHSDCTQTACIISSVSYALNPVTLLP